MTLVRSDLEMILEEMDKNNADNINVDYNYEENYIDFDMYNGEKYIKTVLTLY